MAHAKTLKKRIRSFRNRLVRRFFETRYGRELLANVLPARVIEMTSDCGDHLLTYSPHDYIGRKVFRKGHFERPAVRRLRGLLEAEGIDLSGRVLLELGGNIGTQTIYWAREQLFSRIVTVEADPRNIRTLRRNLLQNDLEDLVTLVPVAAGEAEGRITFFQNPDNHGKSSALQSSSRDRQIEVPVRPVSSILRDLDIPPEAIGLVWMDIEGYEPVAIRSMIPLLALGVPVYLEFSPDFYGADAAPFRALLARHYGRAWMFRDEAPVRTLSPADLPLDIGQFDVLLLP